MWEIKTTDAFDHWLRSLSDADRACVLAALMVLREKGPGLPRPYADTVKGSRYSNMKELRIQSRGEPLRAFFAFDPNRIGMVLCAGNKAGDEKRFYDRMLQIADREFTNWLNTLKEKE
ncbi:diaminopimelate decarboxylase [Serratia sp. SRS-8-S-2018]|uniref:type II toxin-antitoxin system RelE/ParE family toxin n=1 Tax=Serratia TaxID=613 RepID=UPI00097779D3|nr:MULTISPECIES: type II toxin-antitoxin system RelE/ParE family toxin [Serratia]EIT7186511.1 type II toxin-antitoxin system RelE/ParE family toxin [Serratia marcescens]EJC6391393.1 type II toxin-antitoxin system RelE/ParE family toxin [Serratia marcescens]OMP54677.1 diaminopimelate decarboxylase [Serratia marcescens]RZF19998.1 diaminopimelate decarboxylase [Serratia marcescens]TPW52561.1 diaminopimelate decarboxylase [Serratia sp. SRS-8-S-2018]